MKLTHELSPEARDAVRSVHRGAHEIALALVLLALGLVIAARYLARRPG